MHIQKLLVQNFKYMENDFFNEKISKLNEVLIKDKEVYVPKMEGKIKPEAMEYVMSYMGNAQYEMSQAKQASF